MWNTKDGKKIGKWVDEVAVKDHSNDGWKTTGKSKMSYSAPEWIADKKAGGVLLLDDWNRADVRFIQACMELVDRQQYISWTLPKDWHIILTANPDNGDYSLSFDGVDDYVEIGNSTDLNPSTALSVSLYFKTAEQGRVQYIFSNEYQ